MPTKSRHPLFRLEISGWRIFGLLCGLGAAASLVGYLGPFWWLFENLGVFRLQYAVALSLAAAVWLIRRRWWLGAGLVVCAMASALANLKPFLELHMASEDRQASATAGRMRLAILNVHTENKEYHRVLEFLNQTRPDVVLLEEVDEQWVAALSELDNEYPNRTVEPRADNFGIALYSRFAPKRSRIQFFGDAGVPSIVTEFDLGGRTITLVGTHPLPPVSSEYASWRNGQIEEIASFSAQLSGPTVVAGDLNMTENAAPFTRLLRVANLRDSRRGFGLQPTWPVDLPFMLIPLDHCLVSGEVVVLDRRVGSSVGSDHYPILVDLALRDLPRSY